MARATKASKATAASVKAQDGGPVKGVAPVKSAPNRTAIGAARRRGRPAKSAGERLTAELAHKGDSVGVRVLIRQAARVADRLEAIDKLLSGDARMWAVVSLPRSDDKRGTVRVEVRVDNLMVEERSQTTLFRHLLGEIHKQRDGLPPRPPGADEEDDLVE